MRSKEQIAVLHDLFSQINERLDIIGETSDAYFLCQCVEILKQQGATIDAQATRITELEAQLADAKQVANDCRIVADNAIAEVKKNQWQPIETAPKDGTEIVVGYGLQSGFPKKIVSFNKLHNFWSHYGEANIGLQNNATHWMPLPNPPTMQPKEQA